MALVKKEGPGKPGIVLEHTIILPLVKPTFVKLLISVAALLL